MCGEQLDDLSLQVLIVDDTEGCRELYQIWLNDHHTVQTAPQGMAALDCLDESIDLVILDRNMPGPDGLDVATEIREQGYDARIVMVSAAAQDFSLGDTPLDEYERKPVDRQELQGIVERAAVRQVYESTISTQFELSVSLAQEGTTAENGENEISEPSAREEFERMHDRAKAILRDGPLDWRSAFKAVVSDATETDVSEPLSPFRRRPRGSAHEESGVARWEQ